MTRFSRLARGLLLAAVAAAFTVTAPALAKPSSSSGSSSSRSSSHGYSAPNSHFPAPLPHATTPGVEPPPSAAAPPSASGAPRSGGYAAPGSSAPVMPPSASSSSGYRAPSGSAAPAGFRSGSDAAMTRRGAGTAYTSYKATQSQFRAAAAPPAAPPSNSSFASVTRVSSYSTLVVHRNSYYSSWGYVPPSYIYGYGPHFGMWDAIFVWSLASAAANAAQADWFYHHQYDQGYIDWRRQAEIEAQQNADLRAQLATIDQRISTLESQGVARDPNYLPPGADAQVALAAENVVSKDAHDADFDVTAEPSQGKHSSHIWLDIALVVLVVGIVGYFMSRRATA
jgi:hypothetical protein